MRVRSKLVLALLPCALFAVLTGCSRVRANAAFKDGNKHYKEENFKRAIDEYERAVKFRPSMPEAHFYLGSSHQALYRPGNEVRLETAIKHYQEALNANSKPTSDKMKTLRRNTLGALIQIYSDDPYKNFDEAHKYAQILLQDEPNQAINLFALANLYEKFEKYAEAEAAYKKAFEINPQDVKACGVLAGFYNKPLWEGRARFEEAVQTMKTCTELTPNEPTAYYQIAQYYWDKAYRDPLLEDTKRDEYADRGLEYVEKAILLKPEYVEAITYKGLLYRVKASATKNPRMREQFLNQAETLKQQATEMKKQQALAGGTTTPSPDQAEPGASPAPSGS